MCQFGTRLQRGGRSTPPFFRSAPLKFLTKNQKPIQKQEPNSKTKPVVQKKASTGARQSVHCGSKPHLASTRRRTATTRSLKPR